MIKNILAFFVFASISLNANELINVLSDELQRSMKEFKKEENPPYFLAYAVTETQSLYIASSFGKVLSSDKSHERVLDINLRVGDHSFDNTHIIRGQSFSFGSNFGAFAIPIENDSVALKQKLWIATDKEYKAAIERYEKALSNKAVKVEEEDLSPDLSKEDAIVDISKEEIKLDISQDEWERKLNELSSVFLEHTWIYSAQVMLIVDLKTKYLVNSEGSKLRWTEPKYRIMITAKTKADDGMSLPLYRSYFSHDSNGLPSKEIMSNDINELIKTLDGLRKAPLMTTYSGPAILSGEASGVFFHEIFGHRVEGHREKDPNSSQTFKQSINKEILADFIDVEFDPNSKKRNGIDISGNYKYDDQGQPGKKVVAVKDGKFKSFLMSRSPIENFPNSNGHGRRQPGYKAVSRQSNLMVKASKQMSMEDLKDQLIKLCKEQDKEFGLLFDVVQGGFTFTGRTVPNAFNVMPLVVYKIYTDRRPDELVRGVDLIGTPLTTFKNIVGAADDLGVFNGICGAESGGVPVSASSPSLLVSNIEVQKKKKSQAKPPLLDPPALMNP